MPTFSQSRDFLQANRTDYAKAVAGFRWPDPVPFNWAIDWFDAELAGPTSKDRCGLWIVDVASGKETRLTFGELSTRSNQVANWLRQQGLKRGDHLLLVLNNVAPLWEIMLAAMKLGVVVIPATTLLTTEELADRVERGRARMIVTDEDQVAKCAGLPREGVVFVNTSAKPIAGWLPLGDAYKCSAEFKADGATNADDALLLYFTSGTTAKPKLVRHSHRSYPVGALSTMYWLGLQPGDVHVNISSPGWAKHAWSTFFAPWNAGATVLMVNQAPFNAKALLGVLERCKVTTFCAPPTVWRLMIQEDLAAARSRCARSAARASRSTPRSSTRCRRPGASPSATATARPRPRRRSPTRRARRSSRAPWAGRCRAIACWCSTPTACRPTRARSASTSTTSARPA